MPSETSSRPRNRLAARFETGSLEKLRPFLALGGVIFGAGILMAIVLMPTFAAGGVVVKAVDARLQEAGSEFSGIPRFPVKSVVYARDGKTVLASLYLDNRVLVRIKDISPWTKKAVLATEDKSFYKHKALDLGGLIRAMIENAREGRVVQGGSTITMQLVGNTLQNGKDKTYAAKIRQLALAYRVEKKYSKDQILEMYLNQVYLGNGIYGFGTAAKFYFQKPASKLNLRESAMLAGMIRAPEKWNPLKTDPVCFNEATKDSRFIDQGETCGEGERLTNNRGLTLLRRNDVLNMMRNQGVITPIEAEENKLRTLGIPNDVGRIEIKQPPFFVSYMRDMILENQNHEFDALGSTREKRKAALYRGGLKIYSTLDSNWQSYAQAAANRPWAVTPYRPDYKQEPDVSIVSIDNENGAIRTLLSGRNYDEKHLDLADTPHQPGSSFKPFVLAAAFENGIPPTQRYSSSSPYYSRYWNGNSCSCVTNAEPGNIGYVDLYTALTDSINVVFAQLILDVGSSKVVNVAHRMGITSNLPAVPALAVGSVGITPLEEASAYQTLANSGVHCPAYTVDLITRDNETIMEHEDNCKQVISPAIADTIASMMRSVVTSGTGYRANLSPWAVAGKTGTAQDNTSVWFAGFTKQVTTSVWVGFPGRPESLVNYFGQSVFGGTVAAPIWNAYMTNAMRGLPALSFPPAPSSVFGTPSPTLSPTATPSPSVVVQIVPSVVGLDRTAAERELDKAGFVVAVQTTQSTAPAGTVISQTPSGGAAAEPGSLVLIVVSTGTVANTVEVPNVIGLKEGAASAALRHVGLYVYATTIIDPSKQPGVVVYQSIPAGTEVTVGTTVTITVVSRK